MDSLIVSSHRNFYYTYKRFIHGPKTNQELSISKMKIPSLVLKHFIERGKI